MTPPKKKFVRLIALNLICALCVITSCFFILRSTPLISIAQEGRQVELEVVAHESRPGGRGFLVKAAGTGQADAQCCEVDGAMPAPIIDDVGLYAVAAVLSRTLDVGFTESHFFRILLSSWLLGVIAISLFIALRRGRSFLLVLTGVSVLSVLYSYTFKATLFVNYGFRWSGAGDLFYGLQSSLAFCGLGLVLLAGHLTRVAQSRLVAASAFALAVVMISITEVIRSGAILWMPPLLIWASTAIYRNRLWPKVLLVATSAWFGSKLILLAFGVIRRFQTGVSLDLSTLSHPIWHTLYLGLSYTLDGSMNDFRIQWDDNWLYGEVRRVRPTVSLHSTEYNLQVRRWFLKAVLQHPFLVLQVAIWKLLGVAQILWQELLIGAALMFAVILRVRKPGRGDQLLIASLVGSVSPLLLAIPIPQYLGFALPLSHTYIVLALLSVLSSNRPTILPR